jgi:hypothetical protein
VMEYRRKIYIAKTTPPYQRVISSLGKIRRSSDWAILHDVPEERISRITEGETLEDYCERNFPYQQSVTNWAFGVLLNPYGDDPNSVVVILPLEWDVDEREYLRPYPFIFESQYVIDFVAEDYAVLINPLGSTYYVRGIPQEGKSYYTITTTEVVRYDQINSKGDLLPVLRQPIAFGEFPAWRIGATVKKAMGNTYYHESRLAPMLPELEEAVREYSDLQAATVNHIFPERFEYSNRECTECNGIGRRQEIVGGDPCNVPCKACGGEGVIAIVSGPYAKTVLKANSVLSGGAEAGKYPPPPGYVQKDIGIVELQDTRVDKHIMNALGSINFQFLEQTPLNQSGTAKEVDKDELNNTVHAIAEDLVRNIDLVYRFCALWRYHLVYAIEDIEFMLPKINVPEKYDILSSNHLISEMDSAKALNPVIKNALEIEYASKKFIANPQVKERLTLVFELDPLPNISEDDKMTRLSNKGITLLTYVISSNIQEFVQRALEEDADFPDKPLAEQKKAMEKYAQEQIDKNDEAKAIIDDANKSTGLNPDGTPIEEGEQQTMNPPPVAATVAA